jgi:NADH-quinone oxidoreductase subunit A
MWIFLNDLQLFLVLSSVLFLFAVLLLVLYFFSQLRFYDIEKSSPYECGFMPFDLIQRPFDVRFYRVAIVFMLFDVEVIFLFPWVVIAWEVETFGFVVFFFL